MSKNILIVDDEKSLTDLIEIYLKNEGYTVCKCYTAAQALQHVQSEHFDLAILDVMLPDLNGFDLCRKIREQHFFPVIMLTSKSEASDKITGLTMGADDYIVKPFHPLELTARVKTHLRRYIQYNRQPEHTPLETEITEYDIRGLIINKKTRQCFLYGEAISFTPIEFSILWYLCEHRGSVVPSDELFEAVWHEKFFDNNNTVIAHISRIREKLKEPAKKPKFIKTVWGIGYKIE